MTESKEYVSADETRIVVRHGGGDRALFKLYAVSEPVDMYRCELVALRDLINEVLEDTRGL